MTDIDKNNNPDPLFACRHRGCAEEVSYPADMLAMHPDGGVVCEGCWDEEPHPEDAKDWNELPQFCPSDTRTSIPGPQNLPGPKKPREWG